jgi:hypothetical protein
MFLLNLFHPQEPPGRAMSIGVVSVGPEEAEAFRQFCQGGEESTQDSTNGENVTEDTEEKRTTVLEDGVASAVEVAPTQEERAQQEEDLAFSAPHTEPPTAQHEMPMPIAANADVLNRTDRSQTPPPHSTLMPKLGTSPFIPGPVGTPRTPEQPSIAVPPSVLRPLGEGIPHPSSPGLTMLETRRAQSIDPLYAPAERSLSVEPAIMAPDMTTPVRQELQPGEIADDIQRALQPSLPDDHFQSVVTPPAEKTQIASDDLGDVQTANFSENHVAGSPAASQPSTTLKGVLLTRNPSIPVLMAEPYPYSLSTPGPSIYTGQYELWEEETGLDNSLSSNSTLEKEFEAAKKEVNILDDLDDLDFQYPSESEVQEGFENDVQAVPVASDARLLGFGSMDIIVDLLKQNDAENVLVPPAIDKEFEIGLTPDVLGADGVAASAGVTPLVEKETFMPAVKQAEDRNPQRHSQLVYWSSLLSIETNQRC